MPKKLAEYLGTFSDLGVIRHGKTVYLVETNCRINTDDGNFLLDELRPGNKFEVDAFNDWRWTGSINDLKKLMKMVGLC